MSTYTFTDLVVTNFTVSGSYTSTAVSLAPAGTAGAPAYSFSAAPTYGIYLNGGNSLVLAMAGTGVHFFNSTTYNLRSNAGLITLGASDDVILSRDAANVLALKNATTAQEFRVYGTTTGTKYASLSHDGSSAILGAIGAAGTLVFQTGGATQWVIDNTGTYLPNVDATQAIGAASPRLSNIFSVTATLGVATNANLGGIDPGLYIGVNGNKPFYFDYAETQPTGPDIVFRKARGAQSGLLVVSNGDYLGRIEAFGYDGANYRKGAGIDFLVDNTPGASDMPGTIQFLVTPDGSATPAAALTLASTKVATFASSLRVSADSASGAASTTTFTSASDTTLTNAYVVKGGQAATTANTGWIKIYVGTVASWVPYWSNATP